MNKSWLVPAFFSVAMCVSAQQESDFSEAINEITQNANAIKDSAKLDSLSIDAPTQKSVDKYREITSELLRDATTKATQSATEEHNKKREAECSTEKTYVFISYNINEATLSDILTLASGRSDVSVVMRGIPDGMTIPQGILKIQQLAAKVNPVPSVILDPTLFQQYKVDKVPTMIRVAAGKLGSKGCESDMIAQVRGVYNPAFIDNSLQDAKAYAKANGKGLDLGKKGATVDIIEKDLIEVMKQRAAAIDWDVKKKSALDRSYSSLPFVTLPHGREDQKRRVEAAVGLVKDLKDDDGNVLFPAGTVINPLSIRKFDVVMVVFDASNSEYIDRAKSLGLKHAKKGLRAVYLYTNANKEDGWGGHAKLQKTFGSSVYMLTNEVRDRFGLKTVPSVVTADQSHFIVNEYKSKKYKHKKY